MSVLPDMCSDLLKIFLLEQERHATNVQALSQFDCIVFLDNSKMTNQIFGKFGQIDQ